MTPFPQGGFVAENRGSGFREIIHQLDTSLLPAPKAKDSLSSFQLSFERREHTAVELSASQGVSSKEKIVEYLSHHSTATSRELAAAAGVSISGVRKHLSELVDEGVILRSEPARSPKQRYRLATR